MFWLVPHVGTIFCTQKLPQKGAQDGQQLQFLISCRIVGPVAAPNNYPQKAQTLAKIVSKTTNNYKKHYFSTIFCTMFGPKKLPKNSPRNAPKRGPRAQPSAFICKLLKPATANNTCQKPHALPNCLKQPSTPNLKPSSPLTLIGKCRGYEIFFIKQIFLVL